MRLACTMSSTVTPARNASQTAHTAPGRLGPGPHLGGNVSEWVLDSYTADYDHIQCSSSPCVDPVVENGSVNHVARGGSFSVPPDMALCFYRAELPAVTRLASLGARCVLKHQETRK